MSEVLDELARTPAPPSRLRPADIYSQGRRRHRRLVTAALTSASAVVVTLVAGVALATAGGHGDPARPEPQSGQTSRPVQPSPVVRSYDGTVAATASGDAKHLYAVVLDCATPTTDWYECTRDLVRSDDAGRTWQMRSRDIGSFDSIRLTALTTDILVAHAEKLISPGALNESGYYVSLDGGRTWKPVEQQNTPTPAVTAEGWIEWMYLPDGGGLRAGDPRLARSAPLANPPALKDAQPFLRTATGSLWIAGNDPGTGLPAVAVSNDAGRSWSTHVFTDIPVSATSGYSEGTATFDGHTGYMVSVTGHGIDGGGKVWVHRTTDGGQTWQQVDPGGTAPWSYGGGASYVTPDGAHVILDQGRDDKQSFWISRDGGARYTKVTLTGLPEDRIGMGMPRAIPGGGYLANADDAVYVSTDGLQWRRAVPQVS
ncbi:hypothetical protein OHA72_38525 [Dactylosporangium sp. NBC_01737]|uniref:hypothetical protein n=1 Tax=Dactylosporangium sp. NBC_01737 TaxID=2975959 RepID=UPI002E10677D|nr:hypothetical protein OHA72_38525 [Dactylosporangium sp. NBC_01737]